MPVERKPVMCSKRHYPKPTRVALTRAKPMLNKTRLETVQTKRLRKKRERRQLNPMWKKKWKRKGLTPSL